MANLPFGTDSDVLSPGMQRALLAEGPYSLEPRPPPFGVEAGAVPQRPATAPGAPGALELAAVSKLSLPQLRETLRSLGLSPAGGSAALQERLSDALAGRLDPALLPFVPHLGLEVPPEPDAGSRPRVQGRSSVRLSTAGSSSGGASQLSFALGGHSYQ